MADVFVINKVDTADQDNVIPCARTCASSTRTRSDRGRLADLRG